MLPTPKGYVDISSAVAEYIQAAGGYASVREVEEAFAKGVDGPLVVRLDASEGKRQASEAREWLRDHLVAGNIVAEAGGRAIPEAYWREPCARTTMHTGHFEPPSNERHAWRGMVYEPCFIERQALNTQLLSIKRRHGSFTPEKTREQYERWEDEIAARPKTATIRSAAEKIAAQEGVDLATVEREARRIREGRGKNRTKSGEAPLR